MKYFVIALSVELIKFRKAMLPRLVTLGILLVVAIINPIMMASRGDASSFAAGTWSAYFTNTMNTISTGGLFGFGLVAIWLYGREFVDGTISGLFGLPVKRSTIAIAKFVVFLIWALLTTEFLGLLLIVIGKILGLGPIDADAIAAIGKYVAVSMLTAALCIPFAYVATLTKDYLASIGSILGVVILTSVIAATPLGLWFPYSAPGFWVAGIIGADGAIPPQLFLIPAVSILFAYLTVSKWRRMIV